MKEEVIRVICDCLEKLNIYVYDAFVENEGRTKYLRVVLDSDKILNIDEVVEATKVIDPLIEKANLVDGEYILDVYAKSKGDE